MNEGSRRAGGRFVAAGMVVALVLAACSSDDDTGADATPVESTEASVTSDDAESATTTEPGTVVTDDRAFYILPPGNYGGLPTTDDSLDQLPLYDGLTPLRGNVTDADIERYFLPEDFEPIGATDRGADRSARRHHRLRRVRRPPHHRRDPRRRGLRRRLGDRARSWAPARPRSAVRRGPRSPTCPASTRSSRDHGAQSFVPSAADRAAGHRPGRS